MDGVIFDSEKLYLDCCVQLGEKFHIREVAETMRECIGVTLTTTRQIFLDRYGADFPFEKYRELSIKAFYEAMDHGKLPLKPGVIELMEYLAAQKVRVGLASSTYTSVVQEQLGAVNLLRFFSTVIGGDQVARSKPAPDIFLFAFKRLGIDPADGFVIEDSFNGVRAGHASGAKVIMVPDLIPPDQEMQQLADRIFPSLTEVKRYFEQLDNVKLP